jgi:hypothetical protein
MSFAECVKRLAASAKRYPRLQRMESHYLDVALRGAMPPRLVYQDMVVVWGIFLRVLGFESQKPSRGASFIFDWALPKK